ncbi:MAG TPA: hypothetical protein PK093_09010 [Phycisphaerae bacterium]|nr:hypothetical protein [Phycisphaerae bacterium]
MSRTENATELSIKLGELKMRAKEVRAVVERVLRRPSGDGNKRAEEEGIKAALECHARTYLIDYILAALNWNIAQPLDPDGHATNLVIEQPTSPGTAPGTRRKRMDYFGYDRETDRPLIVVEAKWMRMELPVAEVRGIDPKAHRFARHIADCLKMQRDGDQDLPEGIDKPWAEAIKQLAGYCRSVGANAGEWPQRAVLTNGSWLVLFVNPESTFDENRNSRIDPAGIFVFGDFEALQAHHELLWRWLSYSEVAHENRSVLAAHVPFVVDPATIEDCLYGMRVAYSHQQSTTQIVPSMWVSPVLWLRSKKRTFVQVRCDDEDFVPSGDRGPVSDHLAKIDGYAKRLKSEVEREIGNRVLPLISVEEHFGNDGSFSNRRAVQKRNQTSSEAYVMVTGIRSHFMQDRRDYEECAYHWHDRARRDGAVHTTGPVDRPSVSPTRSYFVDGSSHQCLHRTPNQKKTAKVTEGNRKRCGPRSCEDGGAFCEIYGLEHLLCCRTCVFENVCLKAQVFSLPCDNGAIQLPVINASIPASLPAE